MLDCSPLEWEALEQLPPADSFPPGAPPVWLALDEVQDPVSRHLEPCIVVTVGLTHHALQCGAKLLQCLAIVADAHVDPAG